MLRAEDLSGLPPAYVVTAGFDPLRDEGEAYAERMREAGVPVALRRHPGLIHGFANLTAVSPSARAAMLEVAGAAAHGPRGAAAAPDRPLLVLQRFEHVQPGGATGRSDRRDDAGEGGEDRAGRPAIRSGRRG